MQHGKYSLIKYIPDPIRNEPVNIGMILHGADEEFLAFDWDLRRVSSKITRSDKEVLKHYEEQLEAIENEEMDWQRASFEGFSVARPDFLDKVSDSIGSKVIFESPRGLEVPDLDVAYDELFQRFVGTRQGGAGVRVTKRAIIVQVKQAIQQRGLGDYVKPRPEVVGAHRAYKLPLGIRHAHRRFIEVLNVTSPSESSYRQMASVARLWTDARQVPENRQSELCTLVRYSNGARLPDGERLLRDDGVTVVTTPAAVLENIDFDRVRAWTAH